METRRWTLYMTENHKIHVLVKALTAGINVYGVFWAGEPWSQVMSS